MANYRYSGPEVDAKIYGLSKQILFVWAGVHRSEPDGSVSYFAEGHPRLTDCFLQLHAATSPTSSPEVYYYY